MRKLMKLVFACCALLLMTNGAAQVTSTRDADELKIAAIEALISAPAERAIPIVSKVLSGDHSNEVKERALFILSQTNSPEAQATLLSFANDQSGELQAEAIRMIGISGNDAALADLAAIYKSGSRNARQAVLEAYMIAGDEKAVFDIASNASGDEFEEAVNMLGAMGAREELRELRAQAGTSEALIEAYAISGDVDTLRELAGDDSDSELQAQAIKAMGVVGGDEVDLALLETYRSATSDEIRKAALDGMLMAGNDTGVLELYRTTTSDREKKVLLEYLVMMDSDAIWSLIDQTLDGDL